LNTLKINNKLSIVTNTQKCYKYISYGITTKHQSCSYLMNILDKFSKYLTAIEYPKEKTSWNIAGILKDRNAYYKYDVRDMFELPDGTPAQKGRLDSKADKMVLEMEDKWVILDLEELHQYIKKNKLKKVYVNDLISKLEWTIFLAKN